MNEETDDTILAINNKQPLDDNGSSSEWEYEFLDDEFDGLNDNVLQCVTCKKYYGNITTLKLHIEYEHKSYVCPNSSCKERFYHKARLKQHLSNAHLPSLNLKCPLCEKVFRTKYNLKLHIYVHSSVGQFKCNYENCLKTFHHYNTYRQHMNIHLQKNRKKCPICKKLVTSLNSHKQLHSIKKLFVCNECNKSFVTKQLLNNHKLKHYGITYSCNECNLNYRNMSSLYKHRKSIHSNVNYECIYCSKKFNRKDNLNSHIKRVHDVRKIKNC